tara:strand:- start:99 stop:476 length:378 start_codon:yes stop_codon:yes gene_type:complete
MPTITFDELKGAGILNPDTLTANQTYNIIIGAPTCSGSAYFTMAAAKSNGYSYDSGSAQPGRAKWTNFVGIDRNTLVWNSTRYMWSIVIPPGGGTFNLIPHQVEYTFGTIFWRGTGGITFTYSAQ